MNSTVSVRVAGEGVLSGTADMSSPGRGDGDPVTIRLDDGRQILAPRDTLIRRSDGAFELALAATDLDRLTKALSDDAKEVVVTVLAEQLEVGKRLVESGRVRVRKVVREHEEVVDQPLLREEVTVERVAIERFLDAPVSIRQEGETLVVPLVEEVLVVEKRLMLREEVRITRRRGEIREPQTITLRAEEVNVERVAADAATTKGSEDGAGDGTDVA